MPATPVGIDAGRALTRFAANFTRYACAGPVYNAWVAQHFTAQDVSDSLHGASALDGAGGSVLFYGPSPLKQVFVEVMMLARQPGRQGPGSSWSDVLLQWHARVMPDECVSRWPLAQVSGCALDASRWPLYQRHTAWESGDKFVPSVLAAHPTAQLRVFGVFNAFRFQHAPGGFLQLRQLLEVNAIDSVVFVQPHPNTFFARQCCSCSTQEFSVCGGCSRSNRLQPAQLDALFASRGMPALITSSWAVEANATHIQLFGESFDSAALSATVFASPGGDAQCICPCCASPPRGLAEVCPEAEAAIPNPMLSHKCVPGTLRGLALRTAAWIRQARLRPANATPSRSKQSANGCAMGDVAANWSKEYWTSG